MLHFRFSSPKIAVSFTIFVNTTDIQTIIHSLRFVIQSQILIGKYLFIIMVPTPTLFIYMLTTDKLWSS